jgi:N-acetylmuramoyl-L-alanine amidase
MTRAALGLLLSVLVAAPGPTAAQDEGPDLTVIADDGRGAVIELADTEGYAAAPLSVLERLGWEVHDEGARVRAEGPGGVTLALRPGSPFLRWGDAVLQMTDPTYREAQGVRVPLQLLTDFLPRRLPDRYSFHGPSLTLRVHTPPPGSASPTGTSDAGPPAAATPPRGARSGPGAGAGRRGGSAFDPSGAAAVGPPSPPALHRPSPYEGVRVVVVDPGHGGRDSGSRAASGVHEKTVALGVARAVVRRLEEEAGIEVHLIRDDDTFVPLWERGARATELKGERPGLFLSIHANAFSSPIRGFETYVVSEARTDHERRVAALENAPLELETRPEVAGGELEFILRDLRNEDHQHWSALLAELVQEEVARVHPGPNRGVKQAPLAVITNALMPAVLVEVGYLSHPEEARLLARPDFQADAGEAIAAAVLRFFERYPPGAGARAQGAR